MLGTLSTVHWSCNNFFLRLARFMSPKNEDIICQNWNTRFLLYKAHLLQNRKTIRCWTFYILVLVFIKLNINSRSLRKDSCGKFYLEIKIKINKFKTIRNNVSFYSPTALISSASNKWQTPRLLRPLSDYNHRNKTILNFPNTLCHHVRGRHVLYNPYPGEDNWRNILFWKEGIIHEERHNNENI